MSRRIFEERGLRGARKHKAKAKKRYHKMLATAALLQAVRRLCYHMLKEVGRETTRWLEIHIALVLVVICNRRPPCSEKQDRLHVVEVACTWPGT